MQRNQEKRKMKVYDILNAGPNHRFMVNGKIVSNCSHTVQFQNLLRTHLDYLDFARDLVKQGKSKPLRFCYGNVPDTLGQLVRTALTASPGRFLTDCDFSAIEARVIAWLAGEEWALE